MVPGARVSFLCCICWFVARVGASTWIHVHIYTHTHPHTDTYMIYNVQKHAYKARTVARGQTEQPVRRAHGEKAGGDLPASGVAHEALLCVCVCVLNKSVAVVRAFLFLFFPVSQTGTYTLHVG